MTQSVLEIRSVIRRMRGGSQAYLVQCDDCQFYVVKFKGNPQTNRTLINEWIAHRLFRRIGVSTPDIRLVRLSQPMPNLSFDIGRHAVPVETGLHLGSHCPVDPDKTVIFDFLPSNMLDCVSNLADFGRAFVLDKLLANRDLRQAIFVRDNTGPRRKLLRAFMIDHGMTFGGDRWEFWDAPHFGICFNHRAVYSRIDMEHLCEETMNLLAQALHEEIYTASTDIPEEWLTAQDGDTLAFLLSQLVERRKRLAALLYRHLHALNSSQEILARIGCAHSRKTG